MVPNGSRSGVGLKIPGVGSPRLEGRGRREEGEPPALGRDDLDRLEAAGAAQEDALGADGVDLEGARPTSTLAQGPFDELV